MDIDLTSIIISIVALSIFFVPIMYDQLSKKKNVKKIEKSLTNFAKQEDLQITQHDTWRDSYVIGIDEDSKKLLYINIEDGNENKALIDLSEVKKCWRSKKSRDLKIPKKRTKVTDQVLLLFDFKKQKQSKQKLVFFHRNRDHSLRDEISLADRWVKTVNANLL